MVLTREFRETVLERIESDPRFARALLDEALTSFLQGEPEIARKILRDLVNGSLGFDQLSQMTGRPVKSLHRMLSPHGNPAMDNLSIIFFAIQEWLQVRLDVRVVRAA